jgi:polysaccharide pyruvyl transferase WcaK-like protein
VLSNASLVFARDKDSLAWVTGLRALAPDRLRLAADIAFQFTGSSPERAAEVLEKAGARLDGTPLVGITPNMRVYERTEGKGFENRYVRALSDLCGFFTRQEGCQVVLIPHEISPNTDRKDDRFLGQLVSSLVPGDAARVCVLTDAHSAADLKAVIGQCVFLVGSRYHSLVAALSQRIPAVALGWAHKYEGLMMSAGLGQYVLDLGRNGVEGVSEVVQTAWSRRGLLKALLDSSVPRLEGSALGALEFAARIIEEGMERDV